MKGGDQKKVLRGRRRRVARAVQGNFHLERLEPLNVVSREDAKRRFAVLEAVIGAVGVPHAGGHR